MLKSLAALIFLIPLLDVLYGKHLTKKHSLKENIITKKEKLTLADQKARDVCLGVHNELRARHLMTFPLSWSTDMEEGAQIWADELSRRGAISHDKDNKKFAENIYKYYGPAVKKCVHGALSWYGEITDYNFSTGKAKRSNTNTSTPVDHFTNIVWDKNLKVGVGIASKYIQQLSGINYFETYIVARYATPENIEKRTVSRNNIAHVHLLKPDQDKSLPLPHTFDVSVCKNEMTTRTCNYYESKFNITCTSNSWESFMQDGCYRKCTGCKP